MIDPIQIPILINKLGKKTNILDKKKLDELNISKIHVLYLIALLDYERGITLKELSDFLGFDKANTSRAIKHLIDIKYVTKIFQENLKLKYKVSLTDKGQKIAQNIKDNEMKSNFDIISLFSQEEIIVLKSAISKIIKFLDE